MGTTSVVAVGGSAGGVEALVDVVRGLPADLPACVLVTVHIGADAPSRLPRILSRAGPLPASHAVHGAMPRDGRIYVAPPGRHLLVAGGRLRLSPGPAINRHRPAIDAMFASVARWAGRRALAVVLSGMLDDGATGAALVARAGGRVLVQDPRSAAFSSMPWAALAAVSAARTATAAGMGDALCRALRRDPRPADGGAGPRPKVIMGDAEPARWEPAESMAVTADVHEFASDEAALTRLTCPDCGVRSPRSAYRTSASTAATSVTSTDRDPRRPRAARPAPPAARGHPTVP